MKSFRRLRLKELLWAFFCHVVTCSVIVSSWVMIQSRHWWCLLLLMSTTSVSKKQDIFILYHTYLSGLILCFSLRWHSCYKISNCKVHFCAADLIVLQSVFCSLHTDRHCRFTWGFKVLSSWWLQIHFLKICIPQRFYSTFRMIEDLHISVRKPAETLLKSFIASSTAYTAMVSWHLMSSHQHSCLVAHSLIGTYSLIGGVVLVYHSAATDIF